MKNNRNYHQDLKMLLKATLCSKNSGTWSHNAIKLKI